jgi:hypothetical protein
VVTTYFVSEEISNTVDLDFLRKGRCPWCLTKLTPIFKDNKHVADECHECGDEFYD